MKMNEIKFEKDRNKSENAKELVRYYLKYSKFLGAEISYKNWDCENWSKYQKLDETLISSIIDNYRIETIKLKLFI